MRCVQSPRGSDFLVLLVHAQHLPSLTGCQLSDARMALVRHSYTGNMHLCNPFTEIGMQQHQAGRAWSG